VKEVTVTFKAWKSLLIAVPAAIFLAGCSGGTGGGGGGGGDGGFDDGGNGGGGDGGGGDGGGGDGGDGGVTPVFSDLEDFPYPGTANYAALPAEGQALIDDFLAQNEAGLSSSLPAGTASYSGSVGIEEDGDGAVLLGSVAMSADFDASTISGSMTDFLGYLEGQEVDIVGELLITAGVIDSATFEAAINGTLTSPENNDFTFDGGLEGGFTGDQAARLLALLEGTVLDVGISETNDFRGLLTADRD